MSVKYEWDVETVDDHGDVLDHDHDASLSALLHRHHDIGNGEQLALVRDVGDDIEGLLDRTWAYVEEGELDEFFCTASGTPDYKTPKRFHAELARAIKQQGQ